MLRLLFNKIVKHVLSFKQKDKIIFFLCLKFKAPKYFKGHRDVLKRKQGKIISDGHLVAAFICRLNSC